MSGAAGLDFLDTFRFLGLSALGFLGLSALGFGGDGDMKEGCGELAKRGRNLGMVAERRDAEADAEAEAEAARQVGGKEGGRGGAVGADGGCYFWTGQQREGGVGAGGGATGAGDGAVL